MGGVSRRGDKRRHCSEVWRVRYQPCPNSGEEDEGHVLRWGFFGIGCFRCAVDFVIARFGGDPNCECRAQAGPFCVPCECRASDWNDNESPLAIFQATLPPYRGLARLYAGMAGCLTVQREEGIFLVGKDKDAAALRLLASARTDPLAFDAALYLAADCLRIGSAVPKPLREWAFYAITGRIARPKQKGKYPAALIWRDEAIVSLVRDVIQVVGLKATAAGDSGGESACAAVAEGLRLIRLQPDSYTAIKRIWLNRGKLTKGPKFLDQIQPQDPDWPNPNTDLIHES